MYLCPKFLNFGVLFFFKHKITNFRELLLYYRNKFKQLDNKRISFTQWQIKIMQNEVEKYYNDKE
ncbi:hypothetical protein HMPREF9074_08759 [Capnocytophaga sp. oral taxon 329 str. F0087]|nr:hypothetical protein HMPREF9074_08759 [Capnocytophaga sp. oral taxon 329 str. F0087]